MYSFGFEQAIGSDRTAIRTGLSETSFKYWTVEADGTVNTANTEFQGYPFRLIPVSPALGIKETSNNKGMAESYVVYDLQGRRITTPNLQKGIYIINGKKVVR